MRAKIFKDFLCYSCRAAPMRTKVFKSFFATAVGRLLCVQRYLSPFLLQLWGGSYAYKGI